MSLSERRKRLQELKEQEKNSNNSTATSTTTGSTIYSSRAKRLAEMKRAEQQERLSTVSSELTSRIDTWFKNNEKFVSNYNYRFQGFTGSYNDPYDSTINDWISSVTPQKSNFDKEAASIKAIIEENKDYLNPDYVKSVYSALDSASKVQNDILNNASGYSKYWSQWDSEDAYKRYQKISSISDMSSEQIKPYLTSDNPVAFTTDDGQEVTWENLYNTKFYEELMSGEDFEKYSQIGASVKNPSYAAANGSDNFLGWKNPFAKGEEIGNIVTFSRDNIEDITKAMGGANSNADLADVIGDYRYQYMTDDEVAIYNYYLGKGDTEKAAEYLSNLGEALNARWGEEIAGRADSNAVSKLVFGLGAGLDQFVSGVQNIKNFITGDDAVATTPTQFASSIIREDLGTIGGVAYDLAQTTGNMLPSILVGGVAGSVAGTATMGVSVAGNGYNEMRKLGYDEWQARGYGVLVGASEATLQYLLGGISKLGGKVTNHAISNIVSKFDNAIARVAIDLGGNMLSEGLEEAVQSVLEPAFKSLMTGEGYNVDWEEVFYSGLLGALSAGLLEGAPTIAGTASSSSAANKLYGDNVHNLVTESLEIDPENAHAQRMQTRLDSGKNVSGYQLNRLAEANETAMVNNDVATIKNATVNRLNELGERGNVDVIATALTKQVTGEDLTLSEKNAIKGSKYAQRVANELNTENIRGGGYSSAWAEKLGTDRINADVYGRMVAEMENEESSGTGSKMEQVQNDVPGTNVGGKVAQEPTVASEGLTEAREEKGATYETPGVKDAQTGKIEAPEAERVADTGETITEAEEESGVTLEAASAKYGAQAGAMVHTYTEGQDVAKYDAAYGVAYDMGRSGVSLSYAMNSEATAYLTENQRQLAYEAGTAASKGAAEAQDAKNKSAINGKTGRRRGTVRGDGVSIDDLKKSFNDTQGTAYKLLSTYAEATGIDIVLYKSEANADGKFEGAQGRFKWSEDTIYIDINAGLADIKSVNDLAKYTMMRTFSHEFTHFIEKWNPIWYNELRRVVFDTITERGENVDGLIAVKMEQTGLDYEKASREVVAEAMTDILPDANFVEDLANNHKNIFEKLLAKLKEFLADLKAYFSSIGPNSSREANALKEQVGDSVKYVESVVKLFDRVAVEAVENYQMTVAVDAETNNTDGGITNVTERAEEGVDLQNRGTEAGISESYGGTREEDADRSRVSETVGEAVSGSQEVYDRLEDSDDDSWLTDEANYITPAQGSGLHNAKQTFAEGYGVECHVIKASAWQREALATTHGGKVYVSESIDGDTLSTLVPHEGTHIMKQRSYQPYMDFIDSSPEKVNFKTEATKRLVDDLSQHRGIDIFDMTEEQRTNFFDEMNSFVYGLYESGIIDNAEFNFGWVKGAFNDFDAYINELSSIHEQFKKENAPKQAAVPEATAPEVDTRSLEEREKEYKKKYSSWLKRAIKQYALHYDGDTFLSNGAFALRASTDMLSFARSEFVGQIYETDAPVAAKNALDSATTLLTEAPFEGTLKDNTPVYVFNVDGKQRVFDKKHLSKLDGNLLYIGDFTREAKIIKAVDADGNVVGFLLPMKVSYEVTATKTSKLKSFSSKFQSQIKQEVKPNIEVPENGETTVKLEDFGEKIGGARKDEWGKRGLLSTDLSAMNDRERDKAVKKDNVWKRPDYRKLIEGGEKREILFARNEIRKSLNQNITYSRSATAESKLKLQKVFIDTVREIQAMAEKATTAADIKEMGYDWLLKNGYLELTNSYRSGYTYTDKWRKNPTLHLSNYVQTIEHLVRNFDKLGKLADLANFAVDAESKVPAGYSIHEDDSDHTWFIAKGRYIVNTGYASYEEALNVLKNAAGATKKKTRFVPKQLLGVHRKGPNYRAGKDVKGQDYLDTFGFKGGEFGNWMSEKDRRVSMNYGFDALKDLADALDIADGDISLSGNLSIAFGARGQGLSGAAAHYERERHVINLTKMNGAGSLAHEWFHALDDFAGGYGNNMSTDNLRILPERTQAAMRSLLSTMQYRDATQEETDMAATKRYEQAKRSVEYQVKTQFGWVEKFENGNLTDADTRYFARKPTESDVNRYHELLDKLLAIGDASVVDELSALRKEVYGHVIAKENREAIGYRLWALAPSETEKVQKMRLRSDYYNNSRLFGELHHKDGDYWDSTVEMAARAFACYVADKTNAQNDYLSAHSDSAVTFTADKSGNPVIVKAFPEGQERININLAFDALIEAMKEDGILHERGETVKPDYVQYQERVFLSDSAEKTAGNTVQEQSRAYLGEQRYSYEWFTSKPDMQVSALSGEVPASRADVVNLAKKNAAAVGKTRGDGSVSVYVKDIDNDIVLSTNGLKHGLDRRFDVNAPVTLQAGEILKNSIRINELTPQKEEADASYVMIGAAKAGEDIYIVRSVINRYSSELASMDVLYAVNAKKENRLRSMRPGFQHPVTDSQESAALLPKITDKSATPTDSTISIAQLLEFVNRFFPDILPEDVLRHFGHEARPDGVIGKDTLYQQRTDTLTDREVLQMAAEKLANDSLDEGEKAALEIFKKRLNTLEVLQEERTEQGRLYKEQQFGANVDRAAAAETLNRMHVLDDKIKAANADVLAVENKEVLGRVLKKARKVVEAEQRAHDDEIFKRYVDRTKNAAAIKKYRERIKKDTSDLYNWITKPDHKDIAKHVPDVVKAPVIEFLKSIDFMSKQQLSGKEATVADKEFAAKLENLHKVLQKQTKPFGENYSDYIDLPPGYVEKMEEYVDGVKALVEKAGDEFVINKMTSEQLRELSHMVKALKLYITQMNSFHNNSMYRHVYEAGNDLINELSGKSSDKGKTGAARNFVDFQNIRPSYVWERFGRAGIAIRDELQAGQSKYGFNAKQIVDFTEKTFSSEEVRSYREKLHTFNIGGEKVTMRVSHMMGLYLLSKQEDSLRHILNGGIRVGNFQQRGLSKKIYSSDSHILTQADIDSIVGKLTDRQKKVADALQKFMAEKGAEWGNEVSFKRFGEALFGELNYYPISVDKLQIGQKEEFPEGASLYALLNKGFTKARNKEAANRIMLYDVFDVFASHMSSMAQYNALAIPVLDANKWLGYQQKNANGELIDSVKDELTRVFGAPVGNDKGHAVTFIENILKDINGTSAQGSPYDNLYLKILHNYNISKVAGNIRSALLQPTAIIRAGLVLDTKSIVSAINLADVKKNTEEMLKYSGIAVWKDLGFYDVNISRGMHELITNDATGLQKFTEKSLWLPETLDRITWSAIWGAAKKEVTRKYKLTSKDAGFYELVTKTFEEVIYKTQVVDSVLTKSELMRSKGLGARTVSSFMSEPVTSLSMITDAHEKVRREGWSKNKDYLFRAYGVYVAQALAVALLGAIPNIWRDDDEYEKWYEKYFAAAQSNFWSEIDGLSKLPIVADVWEGLLSVVKPIANALFGTNFYSYSQNTAIGEIVDDLTKGVESLIDLLTNENTKYTPWTWIYALIQGGSAIFGAPFASYAKEIAGMWNNTVAVLYPDLKLETYDAGERNEIKYAFRDGHLTEEEATQHLLEKGIVKNKYEAFFEIEGWKYGIGYSKFGAYYDAIMSEDEERQKLLYDNLYGEKISDGSLRHEAVDSIKTSFAGQVREAYLDGEIEKAKATELLESYGGKSADEAETSIEEWDFELEYGFSWGERVRGYRRGEITDSELKRAVMEIEDEELSATDAYIRLLNLEMANQDIDITADIASKYFEFGEPAGIDLDVFIDFKQQTAGIEGDKDKNGNTIDGTKKVKIMAVIDSLPLTKAQKDALYYASGYKESTIREAPWR